MVSMSWKLKETGLNNVGQVIHRNTCNKMVDNLNNFQGKIVRITTPGIELKKDESKNWKRWKSSIE